MIQIRTRRFGPICVAATVNDFRDIYLTWGFTQEGARRRLTRHVSRGPQP